MLCALCQRNPSSIDTIEASDYNFNVTIQINCPVCGSYQLKTKSNGMDIANNFNDEEKLVLSGVVRNYFDSHEKAFPTIEKPNHKVVMASAAYPKTVDQHISTLLLFVAEKTKYYGVRTKHESGDIWAKRLFLPTANHFASLVDVLKEYNYIQSGTDGSANSPDGIKYTIMLTYNGWSQVGELRKVRTEGKQAFVAMWFHPEMDSIYTEGIHPALREVGHNPYRVDRANHNNRIDDEIISQIRKSRILVCDVTGERSGVYYEAGFAQGLGIPVIWTCNKSWRTVLPKMPIPNGESAPEMVTSSWSDRMHFDTRQFPHILWTSTGDLKKQLKERIQSLGLDLPAPE